VDEESAPEMGKSHNFELGCQKPDRAWLPLVSILRTQRREEVVILAKNIMHMLHETGKVATGATRARGEPTF
jgi:hypothetical protein